MFNIFSPKIKLREEYFGNDVVILAYVSRQFGKLPYRVNTGHLEVDCERQFLLQFKTEVVFRTSQIHHASFDLVPSRTLYKLPKQNAYIFYSQDYSGDENSTCYATVYTLDENTIKPVVEFFQSLKLKPPVKDNNISLIVVQDGDLGLYNFKIKIGEIDIALNYGKEFEKNFNLIMERLNNPEGKGILLLHGDPGTGKTSLIKYIAKNLKKKVIFVPPSMSDALCSPELIGFLMKHAGCVLIIEDAERVISSRELAGSSRAGISNVLNISDGILGDCMGIQIIASFNTARENIDTALLRKGRLIAEHEFKPLSIEDSKKLLDHLEIKYDSITKPMTLSEIYNYDEIEIKDVKERQRIGFAN